MKKNKIKSFCKINLTLRVIKKLRNGYHNISSFITFCDLHDVITISKIKDVKDVIYFSGKFSKGIDKKFNTITKVLYLIRKKNLLKKTAFLISIKKNIPHGSGLGGGSANAANLLTFLNSKMCLNLKKNEIIKIARQVGFDVPINLEKTNVYLTGKKNETIRLNKKFKFIILLVYPNIICSTKKIYKKNKVQSLFQAVPKFKTMNQRNLIQFLKKENNDLQKTVIKLHPEIEKIIDFIKVQNGCYFSRITGSGSVCVGIFSNTKTAIYTQKLIKLKFPKYWSVLSKSI